jgi:cbb3-type cytochrome oxidase subunit 3
MSPIITLPKGQFTPLNDITISGLIGAAINISLIITSVLFLFSLLIGGIKFIISGGDKERADNAKRQLVNAIIGIFVVFTSWAFLNFVSQFFGIDLLSFEIPSL